MMTRTTRPAHAAYHPAMVTVKLRQHLPRLRNRKVRTALSRGRQGLLIRLARGLDNLWGRKGKVFADRYHDRALKSPREVRDALVYVLVYALGNGRKHAAQGRMIAAFDGPDMFTSAPWFDGFVAATEARG